MLIFDSETGFEVTEVEDLRTEIASDWQEAFKETDKPLLNTDPETPQGQIIDSQVAAVNQKDAEILYVAQQFDPRTAEGRFQDALAKIYFLTRKPAIRSTATCTLNGLSGQVIPAGALIQSSVDGTQWALDEDATISGNGTVNATFTCQTEGAISADADTLTKIVTTVSNWDSVTNPSAATVGQTEETQAAFESRRYQSVALNSRGTVGSVYARISELDDVIAVYVTTNRASSSVTVDSYTLGPHSIYAAVLGGDDDEIAEALYKTNSAGCDYNGNTSISVTDENTGAVETVLFYRPTDYPIYIKITIQDDGNLPDGYEDTIKEAVYNNFYGLDTETTINGEYLLRLKMNDDLYSSRFTPSILNAGISNVLTVQLSLDNATWVNNLHIPITASPSCSSSTISVVVQ